MAKTRKIIFWGREDLLGHSVEIFLSAREEWEVIRICNRPNGEGLFEMIDQENPDVVLLYLEDEDKTLPMRLIECYPGVKVIALNLDSNEIETYDRQVLCITEISDLISAVEGSVSHDLDNRRS